MPSKLITAPTAEPISVQEAKLHMRVDADYVDEDFAIADAISAARLKAEFETRRALVRQQWTMAIDRFPAPSMNVGSANWYGPQWGTTPGPLTTLSADGSTGYEIFLPMPPLVSVDSIQYIDESGALQTLASTEYKVDSFSEPARITPAYGKTWPGTRNEINAVLVTFTCGYSTDTVPEGIKAWIKIRVASTYEFREELAILPRGKAEPLPFVDRLLDPYRVIVF